MTTTISNGKTERTLTSILHEIKAVRPKLYADWFSKLYEDDNRFWDWRLPLWYNANTIMVTLEGLIRQRIEHPERRDITIPDNFMLESQMAVTLLEHKAPLYFVHRELFDACVQSSPVQNIDLTSLHFPHEAFAFVLPKGALQGPNGSVPFINVMIDRIGVKSILITDHVAVAPIKVSTSDTAIMVSTIHPETAQTIVCRVDQPNINKIGSLDTLQDEDYRGQNLVIDGHTYKTRSVGATDEENEFTKTLLAVTLNLICAMNARPEIVTRERMLKQIRRDRTRQLWSPNIIGARYRVQCVGGERGEHASPRTHWRRGHFRQQGIGERNKSCEDARCRHEIKLHDGDAHCMIADCPCMMLVRPKRTYNSFKTIWIEPMLVSAKEKDNA